jgi:hypothetical protein
MVITATPARVSDADSKLTILNFGPCAFWTIENMVYFTVDIRKKRSVEGKITTSHRNGLSMEK